MSAPRCEVLPLPGHQVAFSIDGEQRTVWHFGPQYPRPFFYPLQAPGRAESLTRMGHPGAPNHDHHRSVWFAHAKVLGIDFWSDNTAASVRQQGWLAYESGEEEARMAVQLGWFDGHDPQPLMQQELIACLRPLPVDAGQSPADQPSADYVVELQSTFTPSAEELELQQTNFGFLAVRVAHSISAYFGGGRLTGSDGGVDEANLFGKPNRWMDYSGPLPARSVTTGEAVEGLAGITYFDHPSNADYPARWHVREDGWMGASLCLDKPRVLRRDRPLLLRYLLHAHDGPLALPRAEHLAREFADSPPARVVKSTRRHTHYQIERLA